jgi:flagellar biogenesis protein FliO
MEDTARLFIVLIGFCFLIVFVVWIFIAFSKTRVVLDNTNEAVRVCGE